MRYFREPDCSAWLWLLVDKEKRATSRKLRGAIAETVLLRGAAPRAWFRTNPGDGAVVKVDAGHTTLERLLGIDHINVRANSVAAVPPVDLILVIDQSGSLGTVGAWDDLQAAASEFIQYFDDDIDQLGLAHAPCAGLVFEDLCSPCFHMRRKTRCLPHNHGHQT